MSATCGWACHAVLPRPPLRVLDLPARAAHLLHRGEVRHDRRGAARLRLKHRDTEPLTGRRVQTARPATSRCGPSSRPTSGGNGWRTGPGSSPPPQGSPTPRTPAPTRRPATTSPQGRCAGTGTRSHASPRSCANASSAATNDFLLGAPLFAATIPTQNSSLSTPSFLPGDVPPDRPEHGGVDAVGDVDRVVIRQPLLTKPGHRQRNGLRVLEEPSDAGRGGVMVDRHPAAPC